MPKMSETTDDRRDRLVATLGLATADYINEIMSELDEAQTKALAAQFEAGAEVAVTIMTGEPYRIMTNLRVPGQAKPVMLHYFEKTPVEPDPEPTDMAA